MSATIDIEVLHKTPAESFPFNMNFSAKLDDDETIASVTSWTSSPDGLTVGVPVGAGKRAQCKLSDGQDGTKYLQTVIAVTSAGNTVESVGYLYVRNSSY